MPSHSLDGKKIDPKHATPKSKSKANKTKKIFVGGVSQETSADEVKAYFNQFGKVEEAVMLMDQQTKRHRGKNIYLEFLFEIKYCEKATKFEKIFLLALTQKHEIYEETFF